MNMFDGEVPENLVLTRGEFGTVDYIAGSGLDFCPHGKKAQVRDIKSGIMAFVKQVDISTEQQMERASHLVLMHGIIGESDIKDWPEGLSPQEMMAAGQIFAAIPHSYRQRERTRLFDPKQYALGAILSDLLQVLPIKKAAALVGAAADRDTAAAIGGGRGSRLLRNFDTRQYAVEALVLLPTDRRAELFAEMARMDKQQGRGRDGSASSLLSLIASNINQSRSAYNALRLIGKTLTGEEMMVKQAELRQSLGDLRQIVNREAGIR